MKNEYRNILPGSLIVQTDNSVFQMFYLVIGKKKQLYSWFTFNTKNKERTVWLLENYDKNPGYKISNFRPACKKYSTEYKLI